MKFKTVEYFEIEKHETDLTELSDIANIKGTDTGQITCFIFFHFIYTFHFPEQHNFDCP